MTLIIILIIIMIMISIVIRMIDKCEKYLAVAVHDA